MKFDKTLASQIIDYRRQFHRQPELSGQERQTAARIIEILEQIGVKTQCFSGHFGVCGVIEGRGSGPVIALRADMDALPLQEDTGAMYASAYDGMMHACGHDGHMAILLGAAHLLQANRGNFNGTVKLIFQPAEENAPVGGAGLMIDDGVLANPAVDAMFGLHLWPDLPAGCVGVKQDALMAASDRFTIKVQGKSAHAAMPHQGVDAVSLTAAVIHSLEAMMARQVDPLEVATVTVGKVTGGDRYNVVAREVVLEGTVRTFSEDLRSWLPARIKTMLEGITAARDGSFELAYQMGYPVLSNHAMPTNLVITAAQQTVGAANVRQDIKPNLGAEDFGRYLQVVPGAFFWLGAGRPGHVYPLHNPRFDIDESVLPVGSQLMFQIALKALAYYQEK